MGTILQMPQRNKGRVRKCNSMGAAGTLGLRVVGGELGGNVVLLDDRREPGNAREAMIHLVLALFATAPKKQQASIREHIGWLTESHDLHQRMIARSLQDLIALRSIQ